MRKLNLFTSLLVACVASSAWAAESIPAPPDVAAAPTDAEVTASGLASKVLTAGSGKERPEVNDSVKVHYTGWTTDGEMFDSSVARGEPLTFPLTRVIPGWTEGMQLMVEGETRRFWIPEGLAYAGQKGKPQGMLVFDVELLGIEKGLAAPADVAAPPADATVLKNGLAYKVLKAGTGKVRPKGRSTVTVHYVGWTTDGKNFDSSLQYGQPSSFDLDKVIRGWTLGIQKMVEGETTRFWIPEKLAYAGQKGKPQGMLVFDVLLISIDRR